MGRTSADIFQKLARDFNLTTISADVLYQALALCSEEHANVTLSSVEVAFEVCPLKNTPVNRSASPEKLLSASGYLILVLIWRLWQSLVWPDYAVITGTASLDKPMIYVAFSVMKIWRCC